MALGTLFFDAFMILWFFRLTAVTSADGDLYGRATEAEADLACGGTGWTVFAEGAAGGSLATLRAANPSVDATRVPLRAQASHIIAKERFISLVPRTALPSSVAGAWDA